MVHGVCLAACYAHGSWLSSNQYLAELLVILCTAINCLRMKNVSCCYVSGSWLFSNAVTLIFLYSPGYE